jgi:hypothetical protein
MRTLATLLGVFLVSAGLAAQDRFVVLGDVGPWSPTSDSPNALVEVDLAGTAIGVPQTLVTGLPPHGFPTHQLVAVAGGRYVAWIAAVGSDPFGSDCREYVAIADRRLRTVRVVPNLVLSCFIGHKLVADRRRPRLFLHSWATASGLPGYIASIEQDLIVRPIVVSNRLGTAVAYASDVDHLFVTELGAPGDPTMTVGIYRAATGEPVGGFPIPEALNMGQMEVTGDGRRLYLWTAWGALFPFKQEIRLYDVVSGRQLAASTPVSIGGITGRDKFVLDQGRNLILTSDYYESGIPDALLAAFDATTLALLGRTSAVGYTRVGITFQPFGGRGDAAAYVLAGGGGRVPGDCRVWIDAFEATGALRTRAYLPPFANGYCLAAAVILSPPPAPSHLAATVTGRQVTLTWADPGDTSEFEIEAGLAPGRRDLALRLGLVTEFSVDNVPPGVYYVRVRAINEIGTSPVSNEMQVIVP